MKTEKTEKETPKTKEKVQASKTGGEKTPEKSNDGKSVQAQKEHWRDKAKELQGKLDALGGKTPKSETTDVLSVAKDYARLIASGYTDEEIAFLERNQGKGQSILEVAKDPFVKGGIDTLRTDKKVEQAMPNPSSGSVKVDKKTWADMSKDERRKNFEAHKTEWMRKRQKTPNLR